MKKNSVFANWLPHPRYALAILMLIISAGVNCLPKDLYKGEEAFYRRSPDFMNNILEARAILDLAESGVDKTPYRKANALIKSVLMFDPSFAPAYREFGRLVWLAGRNYAEGLSTRKRNHVLRAFDEADKYMPDYPQLDLDRARFELIYGKSNRRLENASVMFEKISIMDVDPLNAELFRLDMLVRAKKYTEALELLNTLEKTYGSLEKFPHRAARILFLNKKYKDAEDAFILAENNGFNRAWFYRDWTHLYLRTRQEELARNKLLCAQKAGLPASQVKKIQERIRDLRN